ncbi:MAG TPA: hypothetical protein VGE07_15690 [Herpetosiphonaceae bacterium]
MLAADLAGLKLPPAALAADATHPATRMRGRRWSGRLRALAGAAVLLGAVTVSPLRVLATDILHELGLIQITNDPTWADAMAAGQTPAPLPPGAPNFVFSFDLELTELATLQAQAGYPVYQAGSLPPGTQLLDRDVQHVVDADYAVATAYQLDGESGMTLLLQAREGKLYTQVRVGDAWTEAVTINGNPGVWIAGATFWDQQSGVMPGNKLIWNADGFTFELVGARSKEESLVIAESVAPAQ